MTDLRNYLVVTAAYWAFTLTDGALRMLVLLHFHALGYSPLELASLFLLYEVCGIVTTLLGGWIGSKTGLKVTLLVGMCLQVASLVLLGLLDHGWSHALQVAYVVGAQGLSGIAKDFTKISAKSAIKVLAPPSGDSALFRWVAATTGSKNALKGAGFFLGGLLLARHGFANGLWFLAGALAVSTIAVGLSLPGGLGKTKQRTSLRHLFSKSRAINLLSASRLLLFGARDVWFVVALPVFLAERLGWPFSRIGAVMALWVVGYGVVQALTPRFVNQQRIGTSGRGAAGWGLALAVVPIGMVVGQQLGASALPTLIAGLGLFGVVFAINSSLHSFLILAYSDPDAVSVDVGFYYMANAAGRLIGTVLSGIVYQSHGIQGCLTVTAALVIAASVLAAALPPRTTT